MKFPKFDNVATIGHSEAESNSDDASENVIQTLRAALQHIERLNDRLLDEIVRGHTLQVENARLEGELDARDQERCSLLSRAEQLDARVQCQQDQRLTLAQELAETRVLLRAREGYINRLEEALRQTRRKLRRARRSWIERALGGKAEVDG